MLIFLHITGFLLLVFSTFLQTFNSKQHQHHITGKTKTKTGQVLLNFSFSFLLFLCFYSFAYTAVSVFSILKYETNDSIPEKECDHLSVIRSWNTTFCYNFPPSTQTAPGGGLCFKRPYCRRKGRTAGKNFFNMQITEKFPKLTLTKTVSNDQQSVPNLLSSPKIFSLMQEN